MHVRSRLTDLSLYTVSIWVQGIRADEELFTTVPKQISNEIFTDLSVTAHLAQTQISPSDYNRVGLLCFEHKLHGVLAKQHAMLKSMHSVTIDCVSVPTLN